MLIDIEGIDGSGKTTLCERLEARLAALGHRVVHAGEPAALLAERGGGRESGPLCERAELLLLAAREAQRVDAVIRPALDRGDWVVTDRYLFSLLAAARHALGLDDPLLPRVLEFAAAGLLPEVVVLLDVEPAIARARRRCRGLGQGDPARGGRFPQAGSGLLDRLHQEFAGLARADPGRWLVLENTWTSLEEAEDRLVGLVLARIERREEPPPAPAPLAPRVWAPPLQPSDEAGVRACLFSACDAIARQEPPVAASLLAGLSGPEVDERRLKLALVAPGVVAHGLAGVGGEGALALRHALKAIDPPQVALSLRGLGDEESFRLREELLERAPGEVAASLEGLGDEAAFALRERLAERAASQVVESLAGDDSEAAWGLRDRLAVPAGPEALALSLTGLDGERAWGLRGLLLAHAPPAVMASLRGLGGERAMGLREGHLRRAPRAVLESLAGVDEERAWAMRERSGERMREALESARGLGCERAWELRARFSPVWPAGCVDSLEGLLAEPRGRALLFELLARSQGDLDVLRAAAFVLDPARGQAAAAGADIQQAG